MTFAAAQVTAEYRRGAELRVPQQVPMNMTSHGSITMRNAEPDARHRINQSTGRRSGVLLATGAAMAAAALLVRYKTRQAERRHPPLGQFIEVDGVRLHYVERGQGQPLVILHGNGGMVEDLDNSGLLDLASIKYRVIAFDRPGFGYSDRPRGKMWTPEAQAELLHHALQYLGIEQAVVVGHSWGTLVAIAMALKYPAYMRGLVLLSGYYFPSVRLDVPLFSVPAIPLLGTLMRHTFSPLLGRLLWPLLVRRVFAPAHVPARFAAFPIWMALRPKQLRASAAENAMMIPAAIALRSRYQELHMPVVILAGDNDHFVSTRYQSSRLHARLLQGGIHLAPGAGHMIHYLAPREIMAAIDEAMQAAKLPDLPAPPMPAGYRPDTAGITEAVNWP